MPDVGTLTVNLIANTASFEGPMANAAKRARSTSKEIEGSFKGMDFGDARGGLMLIDDLIGVHMPRHAAAFAAELPGIGMLMSAAFPIAAVAVVAKSIYEAAEAAKKHREELEKMAGQMDAATASIFKHAQSLQLDNLRMADQIAQLEGRPARNKLAEALIEARNRSIELIASLKQAVTQQGKLLEEQSTGLWNQLRTGDMPTEDLEKEVKPRLSAIAEIMAARNRATMENGKNSKEEIEALNTELAKEIEASRKILQAKLDGLNAEKKAKLDARKDMFDNHPTFLQRQEPKADRDKERDASVAALQKEINGYYSKRTTIINDLLTSMLSLQSIQKDEGKNDGLHNQDAAEQALQSKIDFLNKEYQVSKKTFDAETALAIAGYELQFQQGQITAGALATLKQEALDKETALELGHLEQLKALQAKRPVLVAQVEKEIEALNAKSQAHELTTYAETLNRQKDLLRAFRNTVEAESKSENQTGAAAEALKNAGQRGRSTVSLIHLEQEPGIMEGQIASFLAGADAAKKFNDELLRTQELEKFKRENPNLSVAQYAAADDAIRRQISLAEQLAAAQKIASDNHITAINAEIQALNKLRAAAISRGASTVAIDAQIHRDEVQRLSDISAELIQTNKLGNVFKGTMLQMIAEGKQWKTQVGQAFKQTVGGINSNLAQLAVTGKADFRSLAAGALQSIFQIGLQYFETHAWMLATKGTWNAASAGLDAAQNAKTIAKNVSEAQSSTNAAAANTLADVPYPANIPASCPGLRTGRIILRKDHLLRMGVDQHVSIRQHSTAGGGSGNRISFKLHPRRGIKGLRRWRRRYTLPPDIRAANQRSGRCGRRANAG